MSEIPGGLVASAEADLRAKSRKSRVRTAVLSDTQAFASLQDSWQELLTNSAHNNLFLTWQWLFTWWMHEHQGRTLHIVIVHLDDRLIGIAPLAIRGRAMRRLVPWRALEFLGSGSVGSDYLDLIVREGDEAEALAAIGAALAHCGLPLEFARVSASGSHVATLLDQLKAQGWYAVQRSTEVCPYIRLPDSFDAYLATLGSSHRYNFRRRLRQLRKNFDLQFDTVNSAADAGQALEELIVLHLQRWNDRGGSTAFHTTSLKNFHRELILRALGAGILRMYVLRLDGDFAGILYGFLHQRRFYYYQAAFDPRYDKFSVGLVTLGLGIEQSIEEGAAEFDFLHGDESYKFLWSIDVRHLIRLEAYPSARTFHLFKATTACKRLIQSVLVSVRSVRRAGS